MSLRNWTLHKWMDLDMDTYLRKLQSSNHMNEERILDWNMLTFQDHQNDVHCLHYYFELELFSMLLLYCYFDCFSFFTSKDLQCATSRGNSIKILYIFWYIHSIFQFICVCLECSCLLCMPVQLMCCILMKFYVFLLSECEWCQSCAVSDCIVILSFCAVFV